MLLIFDFDGTIADSLDTFLKIVNKRLGSNLTKIEVRKKGTKKLIKELKIPKLLLPFYVWRARREIQNFVSTLEPFKGMETVIRKLNKKHELAIITSNSKSNVIAFLTKHKLEKCFSEIDDSLAFFAKDKKIKKLLNSKALQSKDCIYIGDETRDVEAAKKAGVKPIAVTWGYESRKLLMKSKADYVADTPMELIRYLL